MNTAIIALLACAAFVCLFSCAGLMLMQGFYSKLHYLAPPAILGTFAVVAAIALAEGWSGSTIKAGLVLLVLAISNPVLTHAAARACYLRDRNRANKKENP